MSMFMRGHNKALISVFFKKLEAELKGGSEKGQATNLTQLHQFSIQAKTAAKILCNY